MNDDKCYLITVLNGDLLLRCALKVSGDNAEDFAMEPEARERLHRLLPPHVQSCGPIVHVEELFEIADVS